MWPLPPVVRTSLCTASLCVEPVTAPVDSTRLTVTATSSTVRPLLSSTKRPPLVARALSVATVVSRWFTVWPTPVPAFRRRPLATTLTVLSWVVLPRLCASTIEPLVAVRLTMPLPSPGVALTAVVITPTWMSAAASRRIAPLVLPNTLLAAITMLPPLAATTSIVPALFVPWLRMSAPVVNVTSLPDTMLIEPVPVLTLLVVPVPMSALAVMSPVVLSVWIRIWPDPSALTAVLSAVAVPSFSTMSPVVLRSTMLPLPLVVRRSLCSASLCVEPVTKPVDSTRLTVTATSPTVRPLLSSTKMPPLVARALSVATVVSR